MLLEQPNQPHHIHKNWIWVIVAIAIIAFGVIAFFYVVNYLIGQKSGESILTVSNLNNKKTSASTTALEGTILKPSKN